MSRHTYTEEDRQKAVGLAVLHGQRGAAERTGVPLSTVHSWWMSERYAQLRTETREHVADQMWVTLQRSLDRLGELAEKSEDLKAVAVAFGVVYDKHALMTGMATSRTEARDITGTLSDADLVAALRSATALVGGTTDTGEGAPEG